MHEKIEKRKEGIRNNDENKQANQPNQTKTTMFRVHEKPFRLSCCCARVQTKQQKSSVNYG